ncbi:SRPBCC domain-containing protein [Paenibacillus sp. Marseille-Q4541]|uniref:SRPBCC family protein n=1 Tax=Paenibacillus sp. Marseille-Q4541 TaxID=2831522 RepID=UPI001BAA72C0|nr:SRPBCC domain-containing protein [Paenibacillus sp. Marseille-Q4541]
MTTSLPEINKTILLNAPIEKVWNHVATAEGIAEWFMPNNFEPVLGHEFILEAGPFGKSKCKVTELDPPHTLSFNWDKDWTITFKLEGKEGQTEFTLIHAGWKADEKTAFGEEHSIVRDRMNQGWSGIVNKLAAVVHS